MQLKKSIFATIIVLSVIGLMLVLGVSTAQAQTPAPTATPTLVIEQWFPTSTPITGGSCPTGQPLPADPATPYSARYEQYCSFCIATKEAPWGTFTPVPSNTPEGFSPTATMTPTATANPNNVVSVRHWVSSTLDNTTIVSGQDYIYGVSDVYSCAFTADYWQVSGTVAGAKYTEGFTMVGEVGEWGYLNTYPSFTTRMTITNNTGANILVHFYGSGGINGTEYTITPSQIKDISISTQTWTTGQPPTKRWQYDTIIFDVIVNSSVGNNSGTGYTSKDYTIKFDTTKNYCTSTNLSTSKHTYTWHHGGTYSTPTLPGICNVPEYRSDTTSSMPIMFWVGDAECFDASGVISLFQDAGTWLSDIWTNSGVENPGETGDVTAQLCFRQFSMTPIQVLGHSFDILAMIYTCFGIWAVKNLIGLIH